MAGGGGEDGGRGGKRYLYEGEMSVKLLHKLDERKSEQLNKEVGDGKPCEGAAKTKGGREEAVIPGSRRRCAHVCRAEQRMNSSCLAIVATLSIFPRNCGKGREMRGFVSRERAEKRTGGAGASSILCTSSSDHHLLLDSLFPLLILPVPRPSERV